jgi:hypothetical protein
MKIAILGWGSLIWDSQTLEIEKILEGNGWFSDGPMLPIEFARISNDGRLTLVIVEGKKEVQTLYVISKFKELDHAILDLSIRESCGRNKIGCFVKSDGKFYSKSNIHNNIESWIKRKNEIEAVIWTDLQMNFKEKIGVELSVKNAINYLRNLPADVKVKAEQYIRETPSAIDTILRRSFEKELKWLKIGIQ